MLPPLEELFNSTTLLSPPIERYFLNTDFRPIGFFHTLHFWSSLTRADQSSLLFGLLRVNPVWIAPFIITALCLSFILRISNRGKALRWSIKMCVFTTGISTMSTQVALLYSFQSQYGFVYEMVGLISSIFMVGLALGTYISHRFIREPANLRVLAGLQILIVLYTTFVAIGLPWIPKNAFLVFPLFSFLTLFSGIFNGADFPIATACLIRTKWNADRAVGTVYGIELWGACIGGMLAGILVAPVLGIVHCFWLASLVNLTAFVILWVVGGLAHG